MGNSKTGMDYLIQAVGTEIMPEEAGWTPTGLYDKILYENAFSIKEVVEATICVLDEKIQSRINEKIEQPFIYTPFIEKVEDMKRIVLLEEQKRIAVSPYVTQGMPVSFRYKKVEYMQQGAMGCVFFRFI